MKIKLTMLLIFLLASRLGLAAESNRKTDIITLYNGNTVTGEIKNMNTGLLELSTNAMGTLKIEWQEIAKLESQYHYEVRLDTGKRLYGKLALPERPGELVITDTYGSHSLSSLEVVEVRQVSIDFKDQIDVYLAAGYSYTNAGSVGQVNFNTDVSFETEGARNLFTGRMVITDTNELTTRSSKLDLSRALWTSREEIFRTIFGGYETNDELGLDFRYSFGGGIGKNIVDTQGSNWLALLGIQVLTEQDTFGEKQESVEGIVSTSYSAWDYKTPELQIKLSGSLYPSITESGRVRGDADAKLKWEIIEDLFVDFTAFGTYDNKSAEDSRFDYGITTGVGWKY
ncbi:MAG: DUF481 domain-containing protein [Halioglobus sp.]